MKTLLFLAVCLVVVQVGIGSPRSPKPSGVNTDRRDNSKQRCMAKCTSSNKCPVREPDSDAVQDQRQDCKDCLTNACGYFDRSNKSTVQDCVENARPSCAACPTPSPVERAVKAKCNRCVKKCRSKSPRSPKPGRRDRDSGTASKSPKPKRQCYKSCIKTANCTSLNVVKEQMKAARNACRECVKEICGPYDKTNRSEIAECIKDAREECDECPPVPVQDQVEKKKCKVCLRKCSPKPAGRAARRLGNIRGSNRGEGSAGRRESSLEFLLRMAKCIRNRPVCKSCPKPQVMRKKLQNATKACRACVKEECGDIDRSNKTEVAECVQEARGDCTYCPPISEEDQRNKKNCSKCLKGCAFSKGVSFFLGGILSRLYGHPGQSRPSFSLPWPPTPGRNNRGTPRGGLYI